MDSCAIAYVHGQIFPIICDMTYKFSALFQNQLPLKMKLKRLLVLVIAIVLIIIKTKFQHHRHHHREVLIVTVQMVVSP